MDNYIFAYYQAIKDGTVVVGKWVRLLYSQIIKGLEEGRFFYSAKKANKAIRFIETFCHHHEGELAPGRINLELWQKAMVALIFGITDADGCRQFREIFFVVGRKNGKTLLAAAIAEYCTFLDGEYGGRIYFAAPKLEQATLCFEAYHQMILQEPELSRLARKRRTDIYVSDNNTTAKPLAFSAKKSDGLNISLCIGDEIASWIGDPGLKFYEVIKSSVGARKQPLILAMSTAGYLNDGIYDELMRRSTRYLLGDSKETRLLPLLYIIDDIGKWNDINELQKSNPNLGVSISVDYIIEEIAVAEGSLSRKREFITKYCNVKQNSSLAWLEAQAIEQAAGEEFTLEDFRGLYAVGGVDLSRTTDLSAATVTIERNGELYVFCQFFLPEEKIDEAQQIDGLPYRLYEEQGFLKASGDNLIDYRDVFQWFRDLVEKYEIYPLKIGYDNYSAAYLVQALQAYGFHTDSCFQGYNLHPALVEVEGKLKDGQLHIGKNSLLKAHLFNAAVKISSEKARAKLIKINPTAHVDGVAALLDAMIVRQKWYGEIGVQLQNKRG